MLQSKYMYLFCGWTQTLHYWFLAEVQIIRTWNVLTDVECILHSYKFALYACFPTFRCHSVVLFHCTVAVVPFYSYVAVAADWLSSYGRTAKIGFNPIAAEQQLRCNSRRQRQIRSGILHVSNVILTVLMYFFTEHTQLGTAEWQNTMATKWWKPGISLASLFFCDSNIMGHIKLATKFSG